ncbi:MAG: type II secretion system protein M [Burkholderiales bacterium]|nr:type II secretion system protein M [Burkholderiales bacterium]
MTQLNAPAWLPGDPRKRSWVAVALLLLVTALVIAVFAVPAMLLHRHYDDGIAKMSRQVSTQSAFNGLRPRLTEKLELLKKRDVKKMFLKGSSSALALAELQEIVRATIDTSGGRVMNSSSVQGNSPKEDGPYRQVTATFTLNANNPNLRRLLYALETKEPYLFIDSVVIQSQIQSGFRPAPGAAEPEMYVQLDVRAFALRAPSDVVTPVPPAGTAAAVRDKAGAP